MARITRAAAHLSLEEVKSGSYKDPLPWCRQRWLIIYNALVDPRKAEEIAKQCGVSKATVQQVISLSNRFGVNAVETPGKGGRRDVYLSLEEERQFLAPFFAGAKTGESATAAEIQRARQPEAFELARVFAASPHGVLAFYGKFGMGKTHLLAAIAYVVVAAAGQHCRFASVVSLFDALQERIQQKQDAHDLLRRAIQAPLLVLDDIDKLKPSEFREETLYKILNRRSTAGLPLALTSNSTPDELARWIGAAGRSRLMQGLIPVSMYGPDYRLKLQV